MWKRITEEVFQLSEFLPRRSSTLEISHATVLRKLQFYLRYLNTHPWTGERERDIKNEEEYFVYFFCEALTISFDDRRKQKKIKQTNDMGRKKNINLVDGNKGDEEEEEESRGNHKLLMIRPVSGEPNKSNILPSNQFRITLDPIN